MKKSQTEELSRRGFLQVAALATGSLALAACAPASTPGGSSSPAADTQELSIWSFPRTEDDVANIFDPLNEKFKGRGAKRRG